MPKLEASLTKREHYRSYCKRIRKVNQKKLSEPKYSKIITLYGLLRADVLFEEGRLDLEYGLGYLEIEKFIPTNPPIDKSQLQFGKKVYLMNYHSDGYVYVIKWVNSEKVANKKRYYSFQASRYTKRDKLQHVIVNKKADYPEKM